MDAMTQIFTARILGADAFRRGVERAPGLDDGLLAIMAGTARDMGFTIMRAWLVSWDAANLTANLDSLV